MNSATVASLDLLSMVTSLRHSREDGMREPKGGESPPKEGGASHSSSKEEAKQDSDIGPVEQAIGRIRKVEQA